VVGHATFVAGLILQQAPGAVLEISPVLDDLAEGTLWTAAQKIAGFAGSGVDILNLSFVCFTADGERAPFSPKAKWVDHSERGVDVQSTYVTGEVLGERLRKHRKQGEEPTETVPVTFTKPYATWDGTSFAAATFTGRIAAGVHPSHRDAREVVRDLLGSQ
jgi:hypothetical protein